MCRVLHLQDQPHEALEGGFILVTTLSGDAKESLLPGHWHMVHDIWYSLVKRLGLLIRSRLGNLSANGSRREPAALHLEQIVSDGYSIVGFVPGVLGKPTLRMVGVPFQWPE